MPYKLVLLRLNYKEASDSKPFIPNEIKYPQSHGYSLNNNQYFAGGHRTMGVH